MNIRTAVAKVLGRNGDEAPDALTLIHHDHEEVSTLFERALDDGTPAAERRTAIRHICSALTVHAAMEEALFYPALRKAGKIKERDSVLEAAEEHGLLKDLIAKIQALAPRDETLKAKVTVLKESVEHHVREEENEMFAEARAVLGTERLKALGAEMLRYKERALAAQRGRARPAKNGRAAAAKKKTSARSAPAPKKKVARR